MKEMSIRDKFPKTFFMLDELEKKDKPFDPRATVQGLGVVRFDGWRDPETGIMVDWDPLS